MHLDDRILIDIYGSCDAPERWQTVLDRVCEASGAKNASVQLFRRNGNKLQQQWCARDSRSMESAAHHDAWVNNDDNPRLSLDGTTIATSLGVVTDGERFHRNPVALRDLQKRLARVGLRGGTGVLVDVAPSYFFSIMLHQGLGEPGKSDEIGVEMLKALAPHLRQAATFAVKFSMMHHRARAISSAFDRLRVGAILCTAAGEVLWANKAADDIIARVGAIVVQNGIFRCDRIADQAKLASLISSANNGTGDGVLKIGVMHGEALQIMARSTCAINDPMAAGFDQIPGIELFLIDQMRPPTFHIEEISTLFCLAPAEARLAIALCQGQSVADYAVGRNISFGTARIQLKRVLAKTDSRRQGDLVGKIYRSIFAQMQ